MRSSFARFAIAVAFALVPVTAASADEAAPTRILDPEMAGKLKRNHGITLQWIDWNRRGTARITDDNGTWILQASQDQTDGPGSLFLDGNIVEIGADYFLFDGIVRITETPDAGRKCEKRDVWRFAITQNRPYWRIRQFEWCDDLTDYIDIYF